MTLDRLSDGFYAEPLGSVNLAFVLGLLLLTYWAFLRPGRVWTIRVTTATCPMRSTVIVAGGIAAMLTTGLIALVLELLN